MMEAAMAGAGYTVKNIESIAEGSDLRARLYTLAVGDIIPWHYHSGVTDWYFCIGGHPADPDPRAARQISNGGDGEDCRFLLLQGVGAYDFNKIED
jgi:hypothetical protein